MRRILFVVLFVPAHAFVTLVLVQRMYASPASPGPWEKLRDVAGLIFTLPVLRPCIWLDPDGDRTPGWLQALSILLNSLFWALTVLCCLAVFKRLLGAGGASRSDEHF